MLHKSLRITIGILGLFSLLLAVAFYFRWPITANFWPWTGYYSNLSPLSYHFLSSITAAICAPLLWIALTNNLHTAAPGALNLVVSTLGITVYIFQSYLQTNTTRLLQAGLLSSGTVVLAIVFFVLT